MWGQVKIAKRISVQFGIIPTRVGTSPRADNLKRSREDHPHACGDKAKSGREFISLQRIIPTRVGTRRRFSSVCLYAEDHPHACGDKYIKISIDLCVLGSSPRVWGQGAYKAAQRIKPGIIPTRVGTSFTKLSNSFHTGDHPHACGDK